LEKAIEPSPLRKNKKQKNCAVPATEPIQHKVKEENDNQQRIGKDLEEGGYGLV
jgi:hypothetical protein